MSRASRSPHPLDLLAVKRTRVRRFLGSSWALMNDGLFRLPPGKWLHRRLRRGLEFTQTDVPLARGGDALDQLEIVLLSDIHAGLFMTAEDLSELFERVAALAPDLVCFVGDLISTRLSELEFFAGALNELSPPLGMFGVPGNHDYFRPWEIGRWTERMEELGVRILINRGVRIEHRGGGFWLAGVDDKTESTPDVEAALVGRRDGEPTILMSHHPDVFVEAARLVLFLDGLAAEYRERPDPSTGFDPPYTSFNVGVIGGGTAMNIVPRECRFSWEYRSLPADDSYAAFERFQRHVDEVAHGPTFQICEIHSVVIR